MHATLGLLLVSLLGSSAEPQSIVRPGIGYVVASVFALDADCKPLPGNFAIEQRVRPRHGIIYSATGFAYTNLPASDPLSHCNGGPRPAFDVLYKASRGFRVIDRFQLVVHTPGGRAVPVAVTLEVQ
jgi:hypothetical protein